MKQPSVIRWLKIYAFGMGALSLLFSIAAVGGTIFFSTVDTSELEKVDEVTLYVVLIANAVMGFGYALLHLPVLFMRQQSWGYIYGLAVIGFGLFSCATWPATVPLLVAWIKPEVKDWYRGTTA